MGNCLKREEPEPTSEAMIIREQIEVINYLSRELSYREKDLRMVRGQVTAFLQLIENGDRENRLLRHELRLLRLKRSSSEPRRVHFSP